MSLVCFICAGIADGTVLAASSNSQYSLKGAKYQLYTNSDCTKKAKDVNGDDAVLTTDSSGNTNTLEMEPGTYYAKEVTASKGYKLDTKVHTVKITDSNTENDPKTFTSKEPPVYGEPNFIVFKTDPSRSFDEKRLEGAEFIVKYYDVSSKSDIADAKPKDWWKFKTVKKEAPAEAPSGTYWAGFDWNKDTPISSSRSGSSLFYKNDDGDRVLPLGWFTIEETKAPDGFKLTSKVYYGHVKQSGSGGDAEVVLQGSDTDSRLQREIFIFEDSPTKTTIKKLDSSTEKGLAGAKLRLLKGSTVVDEWTSSTEAHTIKALPEGTYTLRETSAPYGYELADDVKVVIKEGTDVSAEMKDVPVTIRTSAVDSATGKHIGCITKSGKITDNVHLTGLHDGRKYKVSGKLMNKSTGKPIKDAAGNDITASKEFTATASAMDVTISYTVDSSSFKGGDKVVVYETLQRTSAVHGETVPVELRKHQDINDAAQTIIYPEISTSAADLSSGTHNLLAGENANITDTVTYKGVLANETYTLEGELYDKTARRLTGIKSKKTFKPASENGTVKMDFRFDASSMEGHTLVVFETLKLDSAVLAVHKDEKDEDQTIHIPKIRTTAGIQKDNSEIKDVITYENLLPNKKYVFKGWLVDTATGTKVPDSDGSVSLSTGSKTSGQTEMILKTAKYDDMQGHSMTAFEELYIVEKSGNEEKIFLVAFHKDRNDSSQTVEIYQDLKVRKNVTGNLGDTTKEFEYTASFTDLVPDTAYTVEGDDEKTFMSDASGKAVVPLKLSDDQEVTIKQLPKSSKYQITEAASDHVSEFKAFSEDMANKGAKIVQAEGSNGEEAAKELLTAVETVDLFDGTIVILWKNNRDLATLTAVKSYLGIWAAALAIVLAGTLVLLAKSRRYADE